MTDEIYRKSWFFVAVGVLLGSGIGGYISATTGCSICGGLGAAIGYIIGAIIGLLFGRNARLDKLKHHENKVRIFIALLGFLMAVAGLVSFLLNHLWIGLIGAFFFGLISLYIMWEITR